MVLWSIIECPVRPNASHFSTRDFCYLTVSPYQSNLYPLTSPAWVSLTEVPVGISIWITETYKPPSAHQGMDHEGDQNPSGSCGDSLIGTDISDLRGPSIVSLSWDQLYFSSTLMTSQTQIAQVYQVSHGHVKNRLHQIQV